MITVIDTSVLLDVLIPNEKVIDPARGGPAAETKRERP
jgi:hypothetical protein